VHMHVEAETALGTI